MKTVNINIGLSGGSVVKNPSAKQEVRIWPLGREDPLEKEMATYSNILDWKILLIEEPGGLQPMVSQESDTI